MRTLPLRLSPVDGESLLGYNVRNKSQFRIGFAIVP